MMYSQGKTVFISSRDEWKNSPSQNNYLAENFEQRLNQSTGQISIRQLTIIFPETNNLNIYKKYIRDDIEDISL